MARSHNRYCYETATMLPLCIVVDIHVDVNNTKILAVAMEGQRCVPSALLSNYKIFRTANNIISAKIDIAHPPYNLFM